MTLDFLVTAFRRASANSLVPPLLNGDDLYQDLWLGATSLDVGASGQPFAMWRGGHFGDSNPDQVSSSGMAHLVFAWEANYVSSKAIGMNFGLQQNDLFISTTIKGVMVDNLESLLGPLDTVLALTNGSQFDIGAQIEASYQSIDPFESLRAVEITYDRSAPTIDLGPNRVAPPTEQLNASASVSTPNIGHGPRDVSTSAPQIDTTALAATPRASASNFVSSTAVIQSIPSAGIILDAIALARLSYDYFDSPSTTNGADESAIIVAERGWHLVSRTELGLGSFLDSFYFNGEYQYDNFLAQAYVAQRGNEVALVFAGSQGLDWLTDVTLPATIINQYGYYSALTNAFSNYVASVAGGVGYVFGHSLGGAMAEEFMAFNEGSQYQCITIGSPGGNAFHTIGGLDPRVFNIEHTNDPVATAPIAGLASTGTVLRWDLPFLGITGEHQSGRYLESIEILVDSNLYDQRGGREIVIGGNGVADTINRSSSTSGQFILGGGGADSLTAGSRGDLISGGDGSDTLSGGASGDFLSGGSGRDTFAYGVTEFPLIGSVAVDRILDFNQGNSLVFNVNEEDLIDLSKIFDQDSSWVGSANTVRLVSVVANTSAPAGAILQIKNTSGFWVSIARLDGVSSGAIVKLALTDAQSSTGSGTDFIVDPQDAPPTWALTPSVSVQAESNHTVTFTITRAGSGLPDETVYVSTTMSHGSYNDRDYVGLKNFAIHFLANEKSHTFTIDILGDIRDENDETFGIIVQHDQNDPLSTVLASTTFTILDNDGPPTPVTGQYFPGDNLDNFWSGTAGDDTAYGNDGKDRLVGNAGNDVLDGGDGNDSIFGGTGNDYIQGGTGRDSIVAGDGDDTVLANGEGSDKLDGGLGFDYLNLDRGDLSSSQTIVFTLGGSFGLTDGTSVSGFERMDITTGEGNDTVTLSPVAEGQYWSANGGTDRAILDYSSFSAGISLSYQGGANFWVGHYLGSGSWSYRTDIYSVEEIDITGGAGNDNFDASGATWVSFKGGAGDDVLGGSTGNDSLFGGANNDTVYSSAGNDAIYGGDGDDYVSADGSATGILDGGAGRDHLYLDISRLSAGQVIQFQTGQTLTLSDGTLVRGFERIDITTGEGNDTVTLSPVAEGQYWSANGGTDRAILDYSSFSAGISLSYQGGANFWVGHYLGSGSWSYRTDIYSVEEIDITGGAGNDNFDASGATWVSFKGGAGDDVLTFGNIAAGIASGGSGFDTLYIDRSASTANEIVRIDGVSGGSFTLSGGVAVSGIEQIDLVTGSGNDRATFTNVDQTRGSSWSANGGTDRAILDYSGFSVGISLTYQGGGQFYAGQYLGGGGWSYVTYTSGVEEFDITGGAGNDNFDASAATFAILRGSAGNDILSGSNGNDSLFGGADNDSLFGGDGNDSLNGGLGDDLIDAGLGVDTLVGGAGNDTYLTDGGDVITEGLNAGTDLVESSVSLTLGANIENLTLTGSAAINGIGNGLRNLIRGNDAANILNGGLGNDTLFGGAGNDSFIFSTAPGAGNIDLISDFSAADDTIRLDDAVFVGLSSGVLTASAFAANTTGLAGDATDRIIYETNTGRLFFDSDGLGGATGVQFATMTAGLALTRGDFFVF